MRHTHIHAITHTHTHTHTGARTHTLTHTHTHTCRIQSQQIAATKTVCYRLGEREGEVMRGDGVRKEKPHFGGASFLLRFVGSRLSTKAISIPWVLGVLLAKGWGE